MTSTRSIRLWLPMAALLLLASTVSAEPCVVADTGTGTIELPPAGCEYTPTFGEPYEIIGGLPAGTTIEMAPVHTNFRCDGSRSFCTAPLSPGLCEAPGGSLGGNAACADSDVILQVEGTGLLAGFIRTLNVPLIWEAHSGPRNPGDPVQSFDTDMFILQGQIFGDPDFCTFQIQAGDEFGLLSPGHTTLTRLGPPGSDFNVDSFFDISYEIDFQGCPGTILEGFGGTTNGTIRISTGEPPPAAPALGPVGIALLLAALGATAYWRLRDSGSAA